MNIGLSFIIARSTVPFMEDSILSICDYVLKKLKQSWHLPLGIYAGLNHKRERFLTAENDHGNWMI